MRKLLGLAIFGQVCIAIAAGGVLTVMVRGLAASAHARVACQAQKPPDARSYWSWREVGGRRCYYAGHRGWSKASLYWEADAEAELPAPAIPRLLAPAPTAPPAPRMLTFEERWAPVRGIDTSSRSWLYNALRPR